MLPPGAIVPPKPKRLAALLPALGCGFFVLVAVASYWVAVWLDHGRR